MRQRELYNLPELYRDFEFLADEIVKYLIKKGYKVHIPENYASYKPETNQ